VASLVETFPLCQWRIIGHLTVVCSETWPLNGSEAGGDPALIKTSLLLLLPFKGQVTEQTTVKWSIVSFYENGLKNANICLTLALAYRELIQLFICKILEGPFLINTLLNYNPGWDTLHFCQYGLSVHLPLASPPPTQC